MDEHAIWQLFFQKVVHLVVFFNYENKAFKILQTFLKRQILSMFHLEKETSQGIKQLYGIRWVAKESFLDELRETINTIIDSFWKMGNVYLWYKMGVQIS